MKNTTTYKLLLIAIVFLCSFSAFAQPVITCPGDKSPITDPPLGSGHYTHSGTSWNATATGTATITLTYTLSGATTGATVTNTTLAGQRFNLGETTVTWTATDGLGATATCSFNVTPDPSGVSIKFNYIPTLLVVYAPATVDLTDDAITAGSVIIDENGDHLPITFTYWKDQACLTDQIPAGDETHISTTGKYYIRGTAEGTAYSGTAGLSSGSMVSVYQTICNGSNYTCNPSMPGEFFNLYYKWALPSITPPGSISGTSAQTVDLINEIKQNNLSLAAGITAPATANYSIVFYYSFFDTNGNLQQPHYTFPEIVTVNPLGQVDQPSNQTLCAGGATTAVGFTTSNTVGTTTYAWTNDQLSIGLAASGTDNIASFTATNSSSSPIVATITVTPTFTYRSVGCPGPSKSFTITVRPTPTASISGTTAVCYGATAPTITFTNPQTLPVTVTYNINSNPNTTIAVGASATATVTAPTTTAGTYTYNLVSVVYQDAPTCANILTGSATVTVYPPLVPGGHNTTSLTECAGFNPDILSFNNPAISGGKTDYGYNWRLNNVTVGTSATYDPPAITGAGTYNFDCVVTETCGTFTTTTKVITVVPDPTVTISGNTSVCQNGSNTLSTSIADGTGTYTYQWSSGTSASGPWTPIGSTTTSTTYNPVTTTAGTFYYQVELIPAHGECDHDKKTHTLTVNPLPFINAMTIPVCSETGFTATPVNITYGIVP